MRASLVLGVFAGAALCGAESVSGNEAWNLIQASKDNQTALHTIHAPAWVSAAEFRGTMAILQTCILTLFACIYTALHLNVPDRTDFLSILGTKAKWVMMALIAPEIVLYMAADQLIQALRLKKELKELQEKSERVDKKFNFDLRYAFFVVMGGIRIVPDEIAKFGDRPRPEFIMMLQEGEELQRPVHLTPRGVIDLARSDFWIYVRPERIAAKSKGDVLQKALVLLQVSYMATTCIARRAYGLPLALLEIHTMVHVFCAVAMYALWLEMSEPQSPRYLRDISLTELKPKPLDVSEPELVYDPEWDSALGVMVQKAFFHVETIRLRVSRVSSAQDVSATHDNDESPLQSHLPGPNTSVRAPSHTPRPNQTLRHEGIRIGNWLFRIDDNHFGDFWLTIPTPSPHSSPGTMARWKAVASFLDTQQTTNPEDHTADARLTEMLVDFKGKPLSTGKNLSLSFSNAFVCMEAMEDGLLDRPFLIVLAVALPAIYGGVHLTAWTFEFPTPVEHLLWKIMCLIIMGAVPAMVGTCAVFLLIFVSATDAAWALNEVWGRATERHVGDSLDVLYKIMGAIVLVAYGCARLFIVVESFLSLRSVPIGVYYTPPWLQMIPHA